MYQTGFGLPKDMAKAREWFQKAADQGDVQAKSILKNSGNPFPIHDHHELIRTTTRSLP